VDPSSDVILAGFEDSPGWKSVGGSICAHGNEQNALDCREEVLSAFNTGNMLFRVPSENVTDPRLAHLLSMAKEMIDVWRTRRLVSGTGQGVDPNDHLKTGWGSAPLKFPERTVVFGTHKDNCSRAE
jgi:hypothetical protein